MRIGLATPRLGFLGGLERHGWDLGRALRERGHRVVLLHGPEQGRDPDVYARVFTDVRSLTSSHCAAGLDVAWVQRVSNIRDLAALESIPLALATHDHELTCVRSHRYLPIGHAPCHRPPGLGCIAHGCIVVRNRSDESWSPIRLESPFTLRRRLHELARRGPLVANSRYVASNLVAAGVEPSRVRVIHPLPPAAPRPLVAPPAEPRLLAVAQLVRGKGIDLAIQMLRLLDADCELTVAGDGPSLPTLEALAQRVAPGRVHFLGYVPPEQVDRLYDDARVVLLPSRWPEPFGMVGIEAMRRARAVVGAGHGGIPEWLLEGVSGHLFAPGSVPDLARAVRATIGEPELGRRAYELAESRFSHTRMIDQVESLLRELSSNR